MRSMVFWKNLFFTQAAVLADPALAGARVGGMLADFPDTAFMGKHDGDDRPPLSLGAIVKLWSDPDSDILHCPRCGARRLFLRANGGGLCNMHHWAIWLCPFCNERQPGRLPNGGHAEVDRDAWKAARAAAIRARDAEEADPPPPGVRFEEAVARIRALRDADLLDPEHPLEAASLASAGVAAPVLTGHHPADVGAARLRAEFITPDVVARVAAVRNEILARQRQLVADVESKLDGMRGHPGAPGPKTRFKRGEISQEEYRAILAEKESLLESIDETRRSRELACGMVRAAEEVLGKSIPAEARGFFVAEMEDCYPLPEDAVFP